MNERRRMSDELKSKLTIYLSVFFFLLKRGKGEKRNKFIFVYYKFVPFLFLGLAKKVSFFLRKLLEASLRR